MEDKEKIKAIREVLDIDVSDAVKLQLVSSLIQQGRMDWNAIARRLSDLEMRRAPYSQRLGTPLTGPNYGNEVMRELLRESQQTICGDTSRFDGKC